MTDWAACYSVGQTVESREGTDVRRSKLVSAASILIGHSFAESKPTE
jgi:hypothetical protein